MLVLLSVAVTVNSNVPACVGVPERTPVVVFRSSPPGSAPAATAKVYGALPPLAVRVWLV